MKCFQFWKLLASVALNYHLCSTGIPLYFFNTYVMICIYPKKHILFSFYHCFCNRVVYCPQPTNTTPLFPPSNNPTLKPSYVCMDYYWSKYSFTYSFNGRRYLQPGVQSWRKDPVSGVWAAKHSHLRPVDASRHSEPGECSFGLRQLRQEWVASRCITISYGKHLFDQAVKN